MECCSKFRDINTFEYMLVTNSLPAPNTIKYDGFLNNYFYPLENICCDNKNLINTDISYAIIKNLMNSKEEIFISLLLNSKKDGIKIITKSLDIAVVLDVSGSMSSYLKTDDSKQECCLS